MGEDRRESWHDEDGPASLNGHSELEMGTRLVSNDYDSSSHQPTQHISGVLGLALSERRSKRERCVHFCSDRPTPLCNWPTIGTALVSIVLLGLLLHYRSLATVDHPVASTDADAQSSPEGRLQGNFSVNYDYRGRPRRVVGTHGVVAADVGTCSEQGVGVLKQGGSAVDAAVVTALCQGLHNPGASGIGGGTFMLIRDPNGTLEVVDAREVAPAAASTTMFAGLDATASQNGGLSIAVPLELKGLWLAHQRHGVLPWGQLVRPIAQQARSGFPAHPYLSVQLANWRDRLLNNPTMLEAFFIREGNSWRAPRINETCCARPKLAGLLENVAEKGPEAMNARARTLAEEIRGAGGIITAQDLISAQPTVKQPLNTTVFGLNIFTAPPPSSGACILAALQILAGYETPWAFTEGLGQHRMVEALKHAFAFRQNMGDPGTCPPPVNGPGQCYRDLAPLLTDMLSPTYAASLRALINDSWVSPLGAYGGVWHVDAANNDDHGTSHISISDSKGGAVAMTTTVNTGFGSKFISPSSEILYNDQLDDFSQPGRPNVFLIEPSAANYILPGRKPLSSMSPIMVVAPGGRLRVVTGASGGPRIVSSVLQVLLRMITKGADPQEAVQHPRLHHQLLPMTAVAEEWQSGSLSLHVSNATLQALEMRGHNVTNGTWSGVCQTIAVDTGTGNMVGVSDARKDGAPFAY
ncbi:hypothetical protein WJX73_000384 [Symbiochloris irregularis]|uniref:Glutathione hydrolase n=1 Tax=Symbiochloris irregularis TaxID=706552 RepID=A0AAW1PYJ8_9CHLO